MGYFNDSLDFEKFFAKDTWDRLKKDPKRLLLGVEPASTWAWNQILGRDDEPLVDQMGGPYDGRVLSFGHGNGGVYDRAQAAGIDTDAASTNHDIAHIIAAMYAVGGSNLGGSGAEGGGMRGMPMGGMGGGGQQAPPEPSNLVPDTSSPEYMQASVTPGQPMPISEEQKRLMMAQMLMRS